jgi:general secretion pathway protein D
MVTQLIPIKYSDAQAIVSAITPLISRDATIAAYPNTNTIIITDTEANIKRLLEIINEIDVPGFEQTITIIPLMNAQADTLTQEILQALEAGQGAPPGAPPAPQTRRRTPSQQAVATATAQIKIIPDIRTNSLIVVANEFDTEQVRFLVRELDKPTPVEANNIHVYRLQNALAEDVAAVLTNLAGQTSPAAGGAAAAAAAAAAAGGIRTFYKEVSIVADKTTNSIIITATPQDYAVIATVIDQLDVMRPQVLVETLIAEVNVDFARDLGIQWLLANPEGDNVTFGSVGETSRKGSLAGTIATALAGETPTVTVPPVPVPPAGITLGYLNIDEDFLKAFIELDASASNNDFNVLSAPHVLTLDNQKAIINVSQNVPFITQQVKDVISAGAATTNTTFEYRDVGIILEITPHISPDRMVRLEIKQQVNDAQLQLVATDTTALTEFKREATTTVMVKDRHTIVLGGLMQDNDTVTVGKVPFLGDIPVIGWAFKHETTSRKKTNLLLFITPIIATNVAEAAELTLEKKEQADILLRKRIEACPTFQSSKTFGEDSVVGVPLEEAGPK